MAKRTWTDEEIALLAQHKVPQGRSLNAARIKAWELHIPFRPNDPNAEPTVPPRPPGTGSQARNRPQACQPYQVTDYPPTSPATNTGRGFVIQTHRRHKNATQTKIPKIP